MRNINLFRSKKPLPFLTSFGATRNPLTAILANLWTLLVSEARPRRNLDVLLVTVVTVLVVALVTAPTRWLSLMRVIPLAGCQVRSKVSQARGRGGRRERAHSWVLVLTTT